MQYKELLRKVTLLEGKKRSVSIAQVGEICKIYNHLLVRHFTPEQREKLLKRYENIRV